MKKMLMLILFITFSCNLYAQKSQIKHVVLIGCDGLGAYSIPVSDIPNIKKLMEAGSWSLKARSVLPSSSAVNWASMLMGAGPTLHGYTEWNSAEPEIPSAALNQYGLFPGIFGVAREQRPKAKMAVIYSWEGIGPLFAHKAVDIIVPCRNDDDFCADTAAAIIKQEKPLLTFVHFSEPDNTGHSIGHRTPEYYAMVHRLDERIGRILQAIKDAGMDDETLVIITADHGGTGKGHGGKSLDEVEIPWIIKGPGIRKGHEIKDVIITYDTAATIAYALGLKEPQSWRGKPVLEALIKKKF